MVSGGKEEEIMTCTILNERQRILSASFSETNLNNNWVLYYDIRNDLIILNCDKGAEYVRELWTDIEMLLSMDEAEIDLILSMVSGRGADLVHMLIKRREAGKSENKEEDSNE